MINYQNIYLKEKSLWENDQDWGGFQWLDVNNNEQSIISFLRKDREGDFRVVVINLRPEFYPKYRIGVPTEGIYKEIFNTDNKEFGGSDKINKLPIAAENIPFHGQDYSINISLPPLAGVLIKLKP